MKIIYLHATILHPANTTDGYTVIVTEEPSETGRFLQHALFLTYQGAIDYVFSLEKPIDPYANSNQFVLKKVHGYINDDGSLTTITYC